MVTVCYAYAKGDHLTAEIADVSCENLKNKINGQNPTDSQIRKSVSLGESLVERDIHGRCQIVENESPYDDPAYFDSILMKYPF